MKKSGLNPRPTNLYGRCYFKLEVVLMDCVICKRNNRTTKRTIKIKPLHFEWGLSHTRYVLKALQVKGYITHYVCMYLSSCNAVAALLPCGLPEIKRQYVTDIFQLLIRVARWFVFKPKIPIWVNFAGSCYGKSRYILWPFGLLYSHWKYFMVIWYILWWFVIFFVSILDQEKSF
jgi:hypothetical protein